MTLEEFQSILLELIKKLTDELDKQIATKKRYLSLDEESKLSPEMKNIIKENNISMIGFKSVIINDQNEYFINKKEFIYKLIRLYEYSMGLRLNPNCFQIIEKVCNILSFKNAQKVSVLTIFINIFTKYYTIDEIIRRLNLTHKEGITSDEIIRYATRLRTHLDKVETIYNQDGTINGSEKDENIFNTLTKFLMLSNNQANLVMNASEHILMSQQYHQEKTPVKKIEIIPGNTKKSEDIIAETNANNKIYFQLRKYIDLNNYKIIYDEFIDDQLTIEIISLCEKLKMPEENKKLILSNIAKHNELIKTNLLNQKIEQIKKEEEFNSEESIYNLANYIISSEYFNNDGLYKYVIANLTYFIESIDREIISYAKNEVTYEDYKELVAMAWCDLYDYIKEVRLAFIKIDELARLRMKSDKKGTL